MEFQHFLITRINLGYKTRTRVQQHRERDWLKYRFQLFYDTCFPSVLNQTNVNFQWLIYLDQDTPTNYIQEIMNKVDDFHHIKVLLREGDFGALTHFVPADIEKNMDPTIEYVITSRIDSDDLIHQSFIQEVQDNFNYQDYASINFTFGWVYDVNLGLLAKAKNRSNAFISLIERKIHKVPVRSVCYQPHTDFLLEESRIEILSKKRLWCVLIHNINDSTKFHGTPVIVYPKGLSLSFNFRFNRSPDIRLKLKFSLQFYAKQALKIPSFLLRKIKLN